MSYTPLIFASYDDLKRLDEKSDILKKDTWHDTDTEDGFVLNEIRNEYLIGARFTIKRFSVSRTRVRVWISHWDNSKICYRK